MPRPIRGESKRDFISRYMRSKHAKEKYPKRAQRFKVALELWRSKDG
jgi:hypothetical protein